MYLAPLFFLLCDGIYSILSASVHESNTVYIDCASGDDTAPGTFVNPLLTLHRARDIVRQRRTSLTHFNIFIRGGVCTISSTLVLGSIDSNVTWSAYQKEIVVISGGIILPDNLIYPAKGMHIGVQEVDLSALNITDLGTIHARGYSGGSACILTNNFEPSALELFFRPESVVAGKKHKIFEMVLARYPNIIIPVSRNSWETLGKVTNHTVGVSNAVSARLSAWKTQVVASNDVWTHGLWSWNWADTHRQILDIDTKKATLTLGDDDIKRDDSLKKGGNYYAYNIKTELDAPGEYYVDHKTFKLYFIPPTSNVTASRKVTGTYFVSMLNTIVNMTQTNGVTFKDIEFRHARGAGIIMNNCTTVFLSGCTVADAGMMAVNITGGYNCSIFHSEIAGAGDGGVVLAGGDRQILTPSSHSVSYSTIHHNQRWIMNYAPGVLLAGVGNRVDNCELYDMPQIAVFMQGNDHILNGSYIHDVSQQCSDCGAFYMGRDWTYRGNYITNNIWKRIDSIFGGGVQAVYLDDMGSSYYIADNIFDGVGTVLELGGGRNTFFVRNIVNRSSNQPVHFDNRGEGWDKNGCKPGGLPYDFLSRVPYSTSTAWAKYQCLANITKDNPCKPKYNVISDNIMCNGATTLINQKDSTISSWGSFAVNNTVQSHC